MQTTLLYGPPLSGKEQVLCNAMKGKSATVITTDANPKDISHWIGRRDLFFIDGFSKYTAAEENQISRREISGPAALSEMSIALSDELKEGQDVIVYSLSTMLIYSPIDAITKFLQNVIGKVGEKNGAVWIFLEEGMHDQRVVSTVQHMVNDVYTTARRGSKIFYKSLTMDSWLQLHS